MGADLMNQENCKRNFSGGIKPNTSALTRGLVHIIYQLEIEFPVCKEQQYVVTDSMKYFVFDVTYLL